MTTPKIQKEFVPIGTVNLPGQGQVPVYVTKEWRRPLEELAKLVAELQARLDAAGL